MVAKLCRWGLFVVAKAFDVLGYKNHSLGAIKPLTQKPCKWFTINTLACNGDTH
jgi:hypothetical protein